MTIQHVDVNLTAWLHNQCVHAQQLNRTKIVELLHSN